MKEFYSDRGTNFVGGVRELEIKSFNVEDSSVKSFLLEQGTVWKFNMPLSYHMGGAFERLIGITRRNLNSPLSSFFYWIGFIVELSPSTLLTQRTSAPVEDFHDLDQGSIYTSQWKFVQHFVNQFWTKWRREYLQNIHTRTKWKTIRDHVQVGDVVLQKD